MLLIIVHAGLYSFFRQLFFTGCHCNVSFDHFRIVNFEHPVLLLCLYINMNKTYLDFLGCHRWCQNETLYHLTITSLFASACFGTF